MQIKKTVIMGCKAAFTEAQHLWSVKAQFHGYAHTTLDVFYTWSSFIISRLLQEKKKKTQNNDNEKPTGQLCLMAINRIKEILSRKSMQWAEISGVYV